MDENDNRMIGAGEVGMLREVLPWIADEHLMKLRQLLRLEQRWPNDAPGVKVSRAYILNDVCVRLVALGVAPAEYYVAAGDMFAEAPDDLSGLGPVDGAMWRE